MRIIIWAIQVFIFVGTLLNLFQKHKGLQVNFKTIEIFICRNFSHWGMFPSIKPLNSLII